MSSSFAFNRLVIFTFGNLLSVVFFCLLSAVKNLHQQTISSKFHYKLFSTRANKTTWILIFFFFSCICLYRSPYILKKNNIWCCFSQWKCLKWFNLKIVYDCYWHFSCFWTKKPSWNLTFSTWTSLVKSFAH